VITRRGRPPHPDVLTPAEWRVVDAIRHGMSAPQIAHRRGVSLDAVKYHIANVMAKLGLGSRAELRAWRGIPGDSVLIRKATDNGDDMTDDSLRLGVIGQVSRNVSDVRQAVKWYSTVLGLPHLYTFGDLAFFDCDGVRLFLSQRNGAAGADEPSVLYFRVPDINAAYDVLRARGVKFQGAPHMIHRHDSGMEEWMAFFDDPDGHPLAIMAQVQA
jgi:DNA-binding CsgD family transcriptional regulator/catechol 2,3-dioxygenase-like lactoylglutathione lyase family enzyme